MRFACSAGVRGRRCAAFAISTVEHSVSTALSQATLPRLEGMAGQKFGRTRCPAKRRGTSGKTGWRNFASMHGVHTGNAEELSRRGPESFRSLWRKIGSAVLIPTAEAEKFCRTSRQCPAEALPRNKALRSAECSDHPAAVMAYKRRSGAFRGALHHGGRPSPHQETEAWPQLRTRNARVLMPAKA